MELTTKQRIIILNLLEGNRGNVTELRLLRELRANLGFTEEETARLQIKADDQGNITWNPETDAPIGILIGQAAEGLIVKQLVALHRQGEMEDMHLELLDLFPWPWG